MASPVFVGVGARASSASAASLALALPSGVTAGRGILLCLAHSSNNATHSTAASGWTKIGQWNSGANLTVSLFSARGGAGAPTISWTGAVACAAQIAYYENGDNMVDASLGQTSIVADGSNPHATTGFVATRRDSLAVYFDVSAANTALAVPSGWAEDSAAGGTSGRITFGSKPIAEAGANSGNISVTGGTGAWVQGQIEIMLEAYSGLMSNKMEVGAWLAPPEGLPACAMEIGAWLTPGSYPPSGGRRRRMAVVN